MEAVGLMHRILVIMFLSLPEHLCSLASKSQAGDEFQRDIVKVKYELTEHVIQAMTKAYPTPAPPLQALLHREGPLLPPLQDQDYLALHCTSQDGVKFEFKQNILLLYSTL